MDALQEPTRRAVLTALAASSLIPVVAQAEGAGDTLPLWPGSPPGAPATLPVHKVEQRSKTAGIDDRWLTGIATPTLSVRRPAQPNGAAVLLIPGGGYGFLAFDNEGEEQARWLTAQGVTCFILSYRLPGEGWRDRAVVPLQDAQRGIRLIRARAADYGVDAARVAVLGFSAGGHLAGSLATRHAERTYAPVDAVDRHSARPDLAGLIYPVVSLAAPFTHVGSRDHLLGTPSDDAMRRAASVEAHVDAQTAPIFLTHASDDDVVPIANSLTLYQALLAARRPAELHAFDQGGHGFGVRLPATIPAHAWPALFTAFAMRLGVFPPSRAA